MQAFTNVCKLPGQLPYHLIKICTPYYSDYDDSYKLSLIELSKPENEDIKWEHQACKSCLPALARNVLVTCGKSTRLYQELNPKYTHYLFVDSDIEFTSNAIRRLLTDDLDIVSGAYVSRDNTRCYQAGMWEVVEGNPGQMIDIRSKDVHRVDWVGAGFLMVKAEALQKMQYPWFRHDMVRHMENVDGRCVYHQIETNEDIGFCMLAKQSGYKVHLDCNAFILHHIEADPRPMVMTPIGRKFTLDVAKMAAGCSGAQGTG